MSQGCPPGRFEPHRRSHERVVADPRNGPNRASTVATPPLRYQAISSPIAGSLTSLLVAASGRSGRRHCPRCENGTAARRFAERRPIHPPSPCRAKCESLPSFPTRRQTGRKTSDAPVTNSDCCSGVREVLGSRLETVSSRQVALLAASLLMAGCAELERNLVAERTARCWHRVLLPLMQVKPSKKAACPFDGDFACRTAVLAHLCI